jgi:DNA ligase-associated metallophosphoesterase
VDKNLTLTWHGITLVLDYRKAVFAPDTAALILADLHAGKATHFRKAGIPIPGGIIEQDLFRLDDLLTAYQPKKLVFAGDLFHSTRNNEWLVFSRWRSKHPDIEMYLTVGNHDILPKRHFEEAGLLCSDSVLFDGFAVCHDHSGKTLEIPTFAGHLHPVVRLESGAKQRLTVPCFYFEDKKALLPSFGRFTGGAFVTPKERSRVIAALPEHLLEIKTAPQTRWKRFS